MKPFRSLSNGRLARSGSSFRVDHAFMAATPPTPIGLMADAVRGHGSSRDAVLDEEIHFFDLFRFDEIFRAEVGHLPGDARSERFNIGEAIDGPDARTASDQGFPVLLHSGS